MLDNRKNQKTPYSTAIIGLGKIASRYEEDPRRSGTFTHAMAYTSDPRFKLVAGCDPDSHQRELFKKRWKGVRVYSDVQEMLTKEKPQVVSLCTPADIRIDIISQCLRSDIKALFCEKPLASTLHEAQALKNLITQKEITFAVNFTRRWDQLHQKLAQDIQKKRWGELQSIDVYYSGSLNAIASHALDSLRMLVGEVAWVAAIPPYTSFETGDCGGSGILGFKTFPGVVTLHHLDRKNYYLYEMDLYFQKARLRLEDSGFKTSFWKVGPSPLFSSEKALISARSPYNPGYEKALPDALDDLAKCLSDKKSPLCTLEDGWRAVRIEEALRHSAARGGAKVCL